MSFPPWYNGTNDGHIYQQPTYQAGMPQQQAPRGNGALHDARLNQAQTHYIVPGNHTPQPVGFPPAQQNWPQTYTQPTQYYAAPAFQHVGPTMQHMSTHSGSPDAPSQRGPSSQVSWQQTTNHTRNSDPGFERQWSASQQTSNHLQHAPQNNPLSQMSHGHTPSHLSNTTAPRRHGSSSQHNPARIHNMGAQHIISRQSPASASPPVMHDGQVLSYQPSPQSRVVQTQPSENSIRSIKQGQSEPVKRRKSNDGAVLQDKQPNAGSAPKPPVPSQHLPSSSPLTQLRTSQLPPPPTPEVKDDTRSTLLALAEEYVTAADSMTPSLAHGTDDDLRHHQRLIATSISCLEAVLDNFRQPTVREEARIRLKLASLILQETDDTDKASEILTKGVAACEKARLMDLKYTMCYLLVDCSRNQTSRLKMVDRLISDVDAQMSQHWRYAFRLLKLSLCLVSDPSTTIPSTILTQIKALGEGVGMEMQCFISCLETIVHLRSGSTKGLEAAVTSLAGVHAHQTNLMSPQLKSLGSMLRMACLLMTGDADKMQTALETMQRDQEEAAKTKGWRDDGTFVISMNLKAGEHILADSAGIFVASHQSCLGLKVRWINKAAMLAVGYILSGIALLPRNGETRKSEVFFNEALKLNDQSSAAHNSSVDDHVARQRYHRRRIDIKLLTASALLARARYDETLVVLKEVRQEAMISGLPMNAVRSKIDLLTGMCMQGSGDIKKALELYSTRPPDSDQKKMSPLDMDLQTLARMNSIHILKSMGDEDRAESILQSVESHCLNHPMKAFSSAYHIGKFMTAPDDNPIMTTKLELNQALTPAAEVKNKQLLSIIMCIMSSTFFTNIVGEQSRKSANAARTLARQAGDNLWIAVGCGMFREVLERSLMAQEAASTNAMAKQAVDALPSTVRTNLKLG